MLPLTMENKAKLLLYNMTNESLLIEEIKHELDKRIEIVMISTPIELTLYIQKNTRIFLLSKIHKESDLDEIKMILAKSKLRIKKKEISLNFIIQNKTQKISKISQELGSQELYDTDTRAQIFISDISNFAQLKPKEAVKDITPRKKAAKNDTSDYVTYVSNQKGFKQINLESGSLEVVLRNSIGQKINAKLEHFEDESIELELPIEAELEKDSNYDILIIFQYSKCRIEINLTGVVESIESSKGVQYLTLKTQKDDEVMLGSFFETYMMRQKSIDQFMALAKGQ